MTSGVPSSWSRSCNALSTSHPPPLEQDTGRADQLKQLGKLENATSVQYLEKFLCSESRRLSCILIMQHLDRVSCSWALSR
nr:hypothetical protein CFP56_31547 [Quercus suber]